MPTSNISEKLKETIENSFCPADRKEWRAWLHSNHQEKSAVWLIFYRKNSEKHNLTWSDAVDEALCFGWIDSLKKKIDEERYVQYFTKRKPKSNWSKINKEKIDQLMEKGLIMEAGLKSIEIAKKNGSWNLLDDIEALVVPPDLKSALKTKEQAWENFNQRSPSAKKGVLYWIQSAKRTETRLKRIKETVENLALNQLPPPLT